MQACAYTAAWLCNHIWPPGVLKLRDVIKCICAHVDMFTRAMIFEAMFNRPYGNPATMLSWATEISPAFHYVAARVEDWVTINPHPRAYDVAAHVHGYMDQQDQQLWVSMQSHRLVEWIHMFDASLNVVIEANNLRAADKMIARGIKLDNHPTPFAVAVTPANWRWLIKNSMPTGIYYRLKTLDEIPACDHEKYISAFGIKFNPKLIETMIAWGVGLKYEPLWQNGQIPIPKSIERTRAVKMFIAHGYSIFGVEMDSNIAKKVIELPLSNRDRAWVLSQHAVHISCKKLALIFTCTHICMDTFLQNATPGSLLAVEKIIKHKISS